MLTISLMTGVAYSAWYARPKPLNPKPNHPWVLPSRSCQTLAG